MGFWRKLSIRIWYLWHFRAIFSYLIQILKGYMPWKGVFSKSFSAHQLSAFLKEKVEWRAERIDRIQHPRETLKKGSGDCDDMGYLWLCLGKKNGLVLKANGHMGKIYPHGLLTSLWQMPDGTREGHCVAIYLEKATNKVWLGDNHEIYSPQIYLTRQFPGSIYRHLAKLIAPGDATVVYCDVVKPNLFSRIHWSF